MSGGSELSQVICLYSVMLTKNSASGHLALFALKQLNSILSTSVVIGSFLLTYFFIRCKLTSPFGTKQSTNSMYTDIISKERNDFKMGTNNSKGAPTYYWTKFPPELHENDKCWPRG